MSDPCDENRIYPGWRHLGGISLMNFSDGKLLFVLSSSATMVSDVPRQPYLWSWVSAVACV